MAKTESLHVAMYDDQIVVPGDRIQDFRGAWWIFQGAQGPGGGWSRIITVTNPDVPQDGPRDFTSGVFPGIKVVPKPRMSLEEEIVLLSCEPREFAKQ